MLAAFPCRAVLRWPHASWRYSSSWPPGNISKSGWQDLFLPSRRRRQWCARAPRCASAVHTRPTPMGEKRSGTRQLLPAPLEDQRNTPARSSWRNFCGARTAFAFGSQDVARCGSPMRSSGSRRERRFPPTHRLGRDGPRPPSNTLLASIQNRLTCHGKLAPARAAVGPGARRSSEQDVIIRPAFSLPYDNAPA